MSGGAGALPTGAPRTAATWPAAGAESFADRAVLAYAGFVAALLLLVRPAGWPLALAGQLALLAAVVLLARAALAPGAAAAVAFAHRWYPVALLLLLYPQAGALRHLVVAHDVDAWVVRWDAALLPARWWATVPGALPPWGQEAVHAVYFSYYLLLFVPALAAQRRKPALVAEAVGVLTFTMLAHFAASFLFPTSGPLALRAALVPVDGPFTAMVEAAYRVFDRGGLAFPSTHAAAAVVAGVYAARLWPRARWACAVWAAAVVASTVLGGFHYTLDSVVGVATGALCAWGGRRLFERAAVRGAAALSDAG